VDDVAEGHECRSAEGLAVDFELHLCLSSENLICQPSFRSDGGSCLAIFLCICTLTAESHVLGWQPTTPYS
jgi:hypothetical protein